MFKEDRRLNTSAKSMSTSRVEVNAVTLQENPFNSEIYLVVVFSLHLSFFFIFYLHVALIIKSYHIFFLSFWNAIYVKIIL